MKRMILLVIALTAALTSTAAALQLQQQALSEKMIRLHVVANSDSAEDQAVKLQVRDAVIETTEQLSRGELEAALPQIQSVAEECLRSLGSDESVAVSLRKERFPTRVYETFALPAGVYTALRVTIGEGEGQNWWCVAFPSICFQAAAEDLRTVAAAAGFTEGEIALITEENLPYELKFKSLELMNELKQWFQKTF